MYNGIGLSTARGTGTNGYVQTNLANVFFSKQRIAYNSEEDIKRAEAEINKKPNRALLDHAKKRQVELKCIELEELMESQGYGDSEISDKVTEYRELLLSQVESGEFEADRDSNGRSIAKDSHSRAELAAQGRDRMRAALGIKEDFVAGSSMDKLKKASDEKKPEESVEKKPEKATNESAVKAVKPEKKRRRRSPSSSSSSSSSSDESSSSDSSDSEPSPPVRKRKAPTPPKGEQRRITSESRDEDRHRRDSDSCDSDSSPVAAGRLQSTVHVVPSKRAP